MSRKHSPRRRHSRFAPHAVQRLEDRRLLAVMATDNTAEVMVNITPSDSGNLLTDDDGNGVDTETNGNSLTVSEIDGVTDPGTNVTGTYGTLDWAADGSYTYTVDGSNPVVAALQPMQSLTDTFTYTAQGNITGPALMLDIGSATAGSGAVGPAHAGFGGANVLGASHTNWSTLNISDVAAGLVFSNGAAATGVSVDLGLETAANTGIVNWASTNFAARDPGTANLQTFQNNTVARDYTRSNGSGEAIAIRVSGLPAGEYDVFIVADDTFHLSGTGNNTAFDVYAGTTTGNANFDFTGLTVDNLDNNTTTGWVASDSYGVIRVQVTAGGDLVVVGDRVGVNPGNGQLNLVQIVPVPAVGTDTASLTVTINGEVPPLTASDNTAEVMVNVTPSDSGNLITDDDGSGVDVAVNGNPIVVTQIDGVSDPGTNVIGTYGTLDWTGDGTYTYTVDGANPAVASLPPLQTLTDTFTYTAATSIALAQYSFTDGTANPTTTAAGYTASAITNGGSLTTFNPNAMNGYATAPVIQVNPPNATTNVAAAIANNSYFQFTVTPTTTLNLAALTFNAARGGGGTPRGWGLRSSVDGFAANITSQDVSTVRPTFSAYSADLSGAEFQNVTDPITFRMYIYSPNSGNSLEFDDITLTGLDLANSDTASLTVTINGELTELVASNNTAQVTEDGPLTDSGNLLTDNDGFGVDTDPNGSPISVSEIDGVTDPSTDVAGDFGSLDWAADGGYTYTLDNANPAVQALPAGGMLTDAFTYTAQSSTSATLAEYSFTDGTANPTSVPAGFTISPLTAGAGLTAFNPNASDGYTSAPVLHTNPAASSTTIAGAVTNNSYFEFTVSADDPLDLVSLAFQAARGGGSTPRGWALRSSVDGYTATLDSADIGTTRPNFSNYNVDLSGAAFQDLVAPVTFRMYVYTPATGSSVEFDNFVLTGQVGATATATLTVTIIGVNDAPEADAGTDQSIAEGDSLTLDASASFDSNGDALTYAWDIDNDGAFDDATGVSPMLTSAQLQALMIDDGSALGTPFTVTVQVSDGALTDTATVTITLTNTPPTASVSAPAAEVLLARDVTFTVSADDPSNADDAAGFTYEIDFDGDGTIDETLAGPMSGITFTTQYAAPGPQTVQAFATDKDGGRSLAATFVINVVPVAQEGADVLAMGSDGASDRIIFYPSNDGIRVRYNNEVYPLSGGSFTITPGTSRLLAFGQGGSDYIVVAGRIDATAEFDGGDGNDYLAGGTNGDTFWGGAGNDIILAGEGDNFIDGGLDADRLEAGSGADVIFGADGSDRLNGGAGDDILDGGAGNDFVFGGLGNDLLAGGSGLDTLNGYSGDDIVLGGDDADQIFGGVGNDLLIGGTGADRLRGDAGDDDVIGGTSALDDDIEAALDAMMASLGTLDLATANPAVSTAANNWFTSGTNRSGFGALADDGAVDDLTGGTGTDEFHTTGDTIRDLRTSESDSMIP